MIGFAYLMVPLVNVMVAICVAIKVVGWVWCIPAVLATLVALVLLVIRIWKNVWSFLRSVASLASDIEHGVYAN